MQVTVDPRAFAIHKLWLSEQNDREPIKKKRDFNQAIVLIHLIRQYLPHLEFKREALQMSPPEVLDFAFRVFQKEVGLDALFDSQ